MNPFGNMGCLDSEPAPLTSRLNFRCCHCSTGGSRNASYHAMPGSVPGFMDKCPNCHSTDVEVVDPAVYALSENPS
jgi:hypothetical protein